MELEASHGKGAPDGVGAVIKRHADDIVNTSGKDVTCAFEVTCLNFHKNATLSMH